MICLGCIITAIGVIPDITPEDAARMQERRSVEEVMTMAADYYHSILPDDIKDKYYHSQYGFTDDTINDLKLGYSDGKLYKYLINQGISHDDIIKTGLIIIMDNGDTMDFYNGRLIFPYWKNCKVVYFIGRQTHNTDTSKPWEAAKYRKLPCKSDKFPYISESVRNDYFYNEDALRGSEYILITEGIADCISAMQAGIPSISPGTTQFRSNDVDKLLELAKYASKVYICNDNEASGAGINGALNMADVLEDSGKNIRLIELPRPDGVHKIDLNDYMKEHDIAEFRELMNTAPTPIEYKIKQIPEDTSGTNLIEELNPIFSKLSSSSGLYIDTYANIINNRWNHLSKAAIKQSIKAVQKNDNGNRDNANGTILWEDVKNLNPALDFTDDIAYVATKLPYECNGHISLKPVIISSDREIIEASDSNRITDGYISRRPLTDAMRRWSIGSIESFIRGEYAEVDVSELYSTFVDIARRHVYFEDESEYDMLFLYITATYFYPMYDAFPYLWLNGEKGRGKSTAGQLISVLAFNGTFSVGSSEADFFRSIEQFRTTMVIDEVETLGTRASAEHQWISRVARAGYQRGATVSRRNVDDYDKRDEFEVYCPKVFINIHGLEDVLADRAIPITMTCIPNEELDKLEGAPTERTPGILELRDKFYLLMMTKFMTYRQHTTMDISDIASLRHAEVFRPILATARFIDELSSSTELYDKMVNYARVKIGSRESNSDDTPEEILKWTLVGLLYDKMDNEDEIPTDSVEVSTLDIKMKMQEYTSDISWCNEIWVGKNLKKLGIIRDGENNRRLRDGNQQYRYYEIKPERVAICIQGDWNRYRAQDAPGSIPPF